MSSAIWCQKHEGFHSYSIGPAPRFPAKNSWKSEKNPKCTKNDQFRQIDFLNTAYFYLSHTPFDAESHVEFFEPICMFVTRFIPELLTKNVSKNRSTKLRPPDGRGSQKVSFRWRLEIEPNLLEMLKVLSSVCWQSFINSTNTFQEKLIAKGAPWNHSQTRVTLFLRLTSNRLFTTKCGYHNKET